MDVSTAIRRLHLQAAHGDDDPDELATDLAALLAQLDEEGRRSVIRHAYWRMPDVPTRALRLAVGGDARLRALAGRGPVTGSCRRCSRIVRAVDRDDVDADRPWLCQACSAEPVRPAPGSRPTTGWEFQPVPQSPPGRLPPAVADSRRWAENYPGPVGT